MSGYKVVFLDRGTIGPGVKLRSPAFDHEWLEYERSVPADVETRLRGADIAITNKVPIRESALAGLPELSLVAVAATGTDVIDLSACRQRGVPVSNIQGYAATTVSEHTFASILGLRRNLFQYRSEVIEGAWQKADQYCYFNRPIHDLAGANLGIIGTGAIARAVGQLGEAFGMTVCHHSLSGRSDVDGLSLVDVSTLFRESDVVTIHCPLTESSRDLVDARRFAQMKTDAVLVNTARGEIVDLDALEQALGNDAIAGAAIDVSPVEPPPQDSILMRLAPLPNMLLTPHIGWASVEAMQVLADQLIDNLEAFVAGHPRNIVN